MSLEEERAVVMNSKLLTCLLNLEMGFRRAEFWLERPSCPAPTQSLYEVTSNISGTFMATTSSHLRSPINSGLRCLRKQRIPFLKRGFQMQTPQHPRTILFILSSTALLLTKTHVVTLPRLCLCSFFFFFLECCLYFLPFSIPNPNHVLGLR